MTRIRPLLAAIAVAAVVVHGLSGHALQKEGHEGMVGASAGLCLLLVTVLGYARVPKPEAPLTTIVSDEWETAVASTPRVLLDARARASPTLLQRFRN